MTIELLRKCLPHATQENILKYGEKFIAAMIVYDINTPRRQAAFIAQVAHESGSFRYVRELASGEAYEGRAALGNTEPGDGVRFRGRGLIQLTGRANYKAVSYALKFDFVSKPEALELPGPACYSAAWFWDLRGLNRLADIDAFEKITRKINGGVNGMADRLNHWVTARKALNVEM